MIEINIRNNQLRVFFQHVYTTNETSIKLNPTISKFNNIRKLEIFKISKRKNLDVWKYNFMAGNYLST